MNEIDWAGQRRALAERKRRIILNNDGNEPVYLSQEATPDEILRYRTSPFVGSQVDTVFYCTWSSGFSVFTHLTKVGQIFTSTESMFKTNKMQAFADAGIDPLSVMNKFCHENDTEFFWSMRMNDAHDGHGADYSPVMLRANRLKMEHPEYMIGSEELPIRYGNWTAMDYGRYEVRDLAFRFVREVCEGYDVDGVELDFFRHPVNFHGPARGFEASGVELGMMSDLIRRIRLMMDEVGKERGRPILLAVRAPDSVEYCRIIGLDIESWMAEGLIDLYIPAGYVRLNPWSRSVDVAHKYHVMVYPALDESRVPEEGEDDVTTGRFTKPRSTYESYRARASEVWASGADGVYLYNYFDPESPLLRELGSPEILSSKERTYFASFLGAGRIAGDGYPHEPFMTIPSLNPASPLPIYPGHSETIRISLYGSTGGSAELGITLREAPGPADKFDVGLNGNKIGVPDSDLKALVLSVDISRLEIGENRIEFLNTGEGMLILADCYIRLIT